VRVALPETPRSEGSRRREDLHQIYALPLKSGEAESQGYARVNAQGITQGGAEQKLKQALGWMSLAHLAIVGAADIAFQPINMSAIHADRNYLYGRVQRFRAACDPQFNAVTA
jgi:hypothetical protein